MKPSDNKEEYSAKLVSFMLNELMPRAKKLNIEIAEFMPPDVAAYFVKNEMDGHITRFQTRKILNYIFNKRMKLNNNEEKTQDV